MNTSHFWKGIGVGALAGAVIGVKLKSEEKQIKRRVHRAKRNAEAVIDSIGI